MAEPARDALLERKRIFAVGEHVDVVIAFEHQRIATRQARLDVRGGYSEIGQYAQAPLPVGAHELHGFSRVVRNGKGTDFDVADGKNVVTVEPVHVRKLRETL